MELIKAEPYEPLKIRQLRWKCDSSVFKVESTDELDPIEGIIGQERALKALKLGVSIRKPGYNIFITGLAGTGKTTMVQDILETLSTTCPTLRDYAYVNNFIDPDRPILLTFPKGKGREFRDAMKNLIEVLRDRIPTVLESEGFNTKRKAIFEHYSGIEKKLQVEFNDVIEKEGFTLGTVQVGENQSTDLMPVVNGKAVPITKIEAMVKMGAMKEKEAKTILTKYETHHADLIQFVRNMMKIQEEVKQKFTELERDEVVTIITALKNNIAEKFADEKILRYIDSVTASVLDNLALFKMKQIPPEVLEQFPKFDPFREFDVNVILDNSTVEECPVIIEINPTFTNLFGTIERVSDGRGGYIADFMNIKAGSLLRANGGFLVMRVSPLFEAGMVWKNLKRVLSHHKLNVQDSPGMIGIAPSFLQPESIDIDTKVILIGNNYTYSLLSSYEDDFKKIFKIKADFDYEIDKSRHSIMEYARVLAKLIREEGLKNFDKKAIAYLIELAAKFSGSRNKLTTRFSILTDLLREADFYATQSGKKRVSAENVKEAYYASIERHSLSEEKIREAVENDKIMLSTQGYKTGQINGLAVYGTEHYSFGIPVKITSSVALGTGNVLNVEREAGLSGKTYDKGVLILTGYLKETFGKEMPLMFTANLVFEQSYGMVDGDSASAAELLALISGISGVPLNQALAITGSINQKGEIQPIGGVNEKIEGFYRICKKRGFTEGQGVVIPVQNVDDLMLHEDVLVSVKKGEFRIIAVSDIKEAVEIFTGHRAGSEKKTEKGTVYAKLRAKLEEFLEVSRSAKKGVEKTAKAKKVKKKKPAPKPENANDENTKD